MAASLCRKHDTTPRAVYQRHLAGLQDLMRRGAGKVDGTKLDYVNQGRRRPRPAAALAKPPALAIPAWLAAAGPNLARTARVAIPGAPAGGVRTELLLNDGQGRVDDNNARWLHQAPLPHLIEFSWEEPVRIGAPRIVSGYYRNSTVEAPIEDFALQYHDGTAWREAAGAAVRANTQPVWAGTFEPVATSRLRLSIHATRGDTSRIWEVEFYAPPAAQGRQ